MSRSCHSATFSSADDGVAAQHPGEAGDALAGDRVALVRHRRRALLAAAERLLRLAHLGALQVADLGREPVERRAEHGQRAEQRRRAGRGRSPAWRRSRRRGRACGRRAPRRAGRGCRTRRRRPTASRRSTPSRALAQPRPVALQVAGQPSSFSPNVVGSAWTPCVRPMHGVSRCSIARASTAAMAPVERREDDRPASRSCSARPVSTTSDDVSP